jgi:hypothetical protein
MRNYPDVGIQVGEVLLPNLQVDMKKWAVIACDQFTSQPEYWQNVQHLVGDAPSTLNLVLPEAYLGTPEEHARVQSSQAHMRNYIDHQLLEAYAGLIYVERKVDGKTRRGLMIALDLEQYDFSKTSQSLIRATEGTILERLPPRMRIREGAPLELPHILVLIDDPQRTVIEPIAAQKAGLRPLYDTDLMFNSGHLAGYLVDDLAIEQQAVSALRALASPQHFYAKYGVGPEKGILLFAVGDGNHSLATAKSIWEKMKPQVGPDHPARYALVEIENVHDEGLAFEPIHRVLFGVQSDLASALRAHFGQHASLITAASPAEVIEAVKAQHGPQQTVGLISAEGASLLNIERPTANLAVGTIQAFLDEWGKQGGFQEIDYVHGDEVVCQLSTRPGNLGIYLPAMDKSELFRTVILDGSLPRKTFSMGEAHEKRFYMESRKITSG